MSDAAGRFRVLFVCRANVCRSPLAEAVLRGRLAAASQCDLDVASAGLRAAAGQGPCELAAAALDDDETARAALLSHRARQVTRNDLSQADLVITADRDQRSRVVQLYPPSRTVAFTLLEAARLVGPAVPESGCQGTTDDRLRALVAAMNRLRVRHPAPEPDGRRHWYRRVRSGQDIHGDDILDWHGGSTHKHRGTVQQVAATAAGLAVELARVAARSDGR